MKKELNKHVNLTKQASKSRKELEKKVVEGAKRVLKDYKKVFERLAEYDRTGSV